MYYENMMGMHAVWWVFWVVLVISLLFWGGGSKRIHESGGRLLEFVGQLRVGAACRQVSQNF